MHTVGRAESRLLKGIIVFGSPTCAIAASERMRVSPLLEDIVVYTVAVFAVVVAVLMPAWRRPALWKYLALVFTGHVIAVTFVIAVLREFPPSQFRFGIPKLLLIPVALAEGVVVTGMLWKRTVASEPSGTHSM